MAYSKGLPGSKQLREKFQHVSTLQDVEEIARLHLATCLEGNALSLPVSIEPGDDGALPSSWRSAWKRRKFSRVHGRFA